MSLEFTLQLSPLHKLLVCFPNYSLLLVLHFGLSEVFLNRWIAPPCFSAIGLYLGSSRPRPQPSLPSFCSYHFEEVHKKFPLFEPARTECA